MSVPDCECKDCGHTWGSWSQMDTCPKCRSPRVARYLPDDEGGVSYTFEYDLSDERMEEWAPAQYRFWKFGTGEMSEMHRLAFDLMKMSAYKGRF